jgi:hypothetical protein
MTKTQYRAARRLVRDNGRYSLAWLSESVRQEMDHLLVNVQDATDWLAERADIVGHCSREGIACNVRHTRPACEYRGGRWLGVAA